MRAPWPVVAALALLVCSHLASTATAQPVQATTSAPRVLLVLQTPQMAPQALDGFSGVLRAQVSPDWIVRKVRSDTPSPEARTASHWAHDLALANGADAVLWIEAGATASEQWLWLVADPNLPPHTFRADEASDFDRYRTLAMAARSLLPETVRTLAPEEANAGSATAGTEGAVAAPEKANAESAAAGTEGAVASAAPETPDPQLDTSITAPREQASQDASEKERPAAPAPTTSSNASPWPLHGVMGPTLQYSGSEPIAGVEAGVGARLNPFVVIRAMVGWLGHEALPVDMQSAKRDRFALRLMTWASLRHRRGVYQLGLGAGAGSAQLHPTAEGDTRRRAAGLVRLSASAAWIAAEQLFIELPVSLDAAFGPDGPDGYPPATPAIELAVGLRMGFGIP